jgi:hypothetical protein
MAERGEKGWTPVSKGDGIYEKLSEYTNDSSLRYISSPDTCIRRGGAILCWKPLGAVLANKIHSAKKANIQSRYQADMQKMRDAGADPWGPGPQVISSKKDPTDVMNIMAGMGIDPKELDHPDADPRNYVPKELTNVVPDPDPIEVAKEIARRLNPETDDPVEPVRPRKRGRPMKRKAG